MAEGATLPQCNSGSPTFGLSCLKRRLFRVSGGNMEIKEMKIADLKPYEKNPRMNENAVPYVANSIKEFGFKVPIIIDKKNVIVAGHTRYKAAMQLGMDTVPCIVADDLTPQQIKAFRLADNKVSDYSIWDNKLLLEELTDLGDDIFTGFDLGSIGEELKENELDALKENEYGLQYEIKFQSDNKEKIEKIKELWEGMDGGKAESSSN